MKFTDEEIAKALLWLRPGKEFWFRMLDGPVTYAEVVEVNASDEYPHIVAMLLGGEDDYKFRLDILTCRPMWEER